MTKSRQRFASDIPFEEHFYYDFDLRLVASAKGAPRQLFKLLISFSGSSKLSEANLVVVRSCLFMKSDSKMISKKLLRLRINSFV